MAIGKMRDRVTITTQSLEAYDDYGDYIPSTDTETDVWAKVEQMDSEEVINNGMRKGVNGYKVKMRYNGNVNTNSELTYNDTALKIESVKHDRLQDYTEITASDE